MPLNSEDSLARQRELSPILLMRKLGPERGKKLAKCACASIFMYMNVCVCFCVYVQEGPWMLPWAWIQLWEELVSRDAWRRTFQPTASVWSHSDWAKYTAAKISGQHKNVGVAPSSLPSFPLLPPPTGWNFLKQAGPVNESIHAVSKNNWRSALGHMWKHVPWHAHICTCTCVHA